MRKRSLGLLFLAVLSLLVLITSQKVFAAESNYKTEYNVTYTIDPDWTAHTVMKIGLTNQTSTYYASSYKVQLGFSDVTNIQASDSQGPITPVLKKMDKGVQVELDFNDKVVGVGNTLHFTLSFDTDDIAKKHGGIWEINIPSTSKQNSFSAFTVQVKPPASFGVPTVVRPKRMAKTLTFTKEETGASGISILFGDKQTYTYHLTYHLKNTNLYPLTTEVALPPTTNYQQSTLDSISPKPSNVVLDGDGNWLAQYPLKPGQKVDVLVDGEATVSLHPSPSPLSNDDRALFTKEQPYWQLSSEEKQKAKDLKTAKNIYDFVVQTLHYDYNRRTSTTETRIGADNILRRPTEAVCLEFTDLFIALARASGIPAREVDGYAYTDNQGDRPLSLIPDVLHAWPEYYDDASRSWIMVDPTWGNTTGGMDYFTTLDLSHVTFVIKGKESNYPIPAGGYKLASTDKEKDVVVTFGKTPDEQQAKNFSFVEDFDDSYLAGFPMKGTVSLTNIEHTLLPQQTVVVESNSLVPNRQEVTIGPIPPFGTVTAPVVFHKTSFLTKRIYDFTMMIADRKIKESFLVTPFLFTIWHLLGGIILGILTISVFIIAYKTRRLPFSRH